MGERTSVPVTAARVDHAELVDLHALHAFGKLRHDVGQHVQYERPLGVAAHLLKHLNHHAKRFGFGRTSDEVSLTGIQFTPPRKSEKPACEGPHADSRRRSEEQASPTTQTDQARHPAQAEEGQRGYQGAQIQQAQRLSPGGVVEIVLMAAEERNKQECAADREADPVQHVAPASDYDAEAAQVRASVARCARSRPRGCKGSGRANDPVCPARIRRCQE